MFFKKISLPSVSHVLVSLLFTTFLNGSNTYYSQLKQDQYVAENIFNFKRNGVFFDIGAHDGITCSNTYFFEKELGWTGICIEPLPKQFEKLKSNRKCICIHGCIYNTSGQKPFLQIEGYAEMLSGLIEAYDPRHQERIDREVAHTSGSQKVILINTFTFNEICKKYNITHIDFLSIDTEGSEEHIIRSINFDEIDIEVITIENNFGSKAICNYLTQKNYTLACSLGWDDVYVKNRNHHNLHN